MTYYEQYDNWYVATLIVFWWSVLYGRKECDC